MTSDIAALIDFYEREKNIDRDKTIYALQSAFISAYHKMIKGSEAINTIRADIDSKKGVVVISAELKVVADVEHYDTWNQIALSMAQKINPTVAIGDTIDVNITPKDFARIAIQTARNTMNYRLRLAEKDMIYEEFKDRAGDIVDGEVSQIDNRVVWVNLGRFDGKLPQSEQIPTESYNVGDRIRCYVVSVSNERGGAEVLLSRSHNNFLRRLLEREISEVADRVIEVKSIVRDAGFRSKIAVLSNDSKVDPVGACVGVRGSRIKNIIQELNNERIDIVHWSDNFDELIAELFRPIEIKKITVDEENKKVHITVDEENLFKVIGRRGQNIRLASKLIDWDIQVLKDESEEVEFAAQISTASEGIAEATGLDKEVADKLFVAGGISAEMILEMPVEYIMEILDVAEEQAQDVLAQVKSSSENK